MVGADESGGYHEPRLGLFGWVVLAGVTVLSVLLIRAFVVQSYRIPSASMRPTLEPGDHIIVDRLSFGIWLPGRRSPVLAAREPERGDVVVFSLAAHPGAEISESGKYLVKRIVALPGDKIEVRNFQAIVNGEAVDDGSRRVLDLSGQSNSPTANWGPRVLQSDEYCVLGDNRPNSDDSRHFGPISRADIEGRAVMIYWSWTVGAEPFHIRWERLFKKL